MRLKGREHSLKSRRHAKEEQGEASADGGRRERAPLVDQVRLLSWRRPYNVWVCHTSWGDHRETFQVIWHLPQGLESELMGLARDLLSHGTCADFMAAHHCTRGLHTHTHPYTTHTHTFLCVPEIRGRYFGRCATCFRVWRVREWGYQEMCPMVQHV